MSTTDKSATKQSPSLLWSMARFFWGACFCGALILGVLAAVFVLIASAFDPNSTRVGGSNDPAGVAGLVFLVWGFVGSVVGAVVGVVGAIVIALRR